MGTANSNERLMRFLQATPEQQAAIERILDGKMEAPRPVPTGPLLVGMGEGAKLLGVSRPTLWRMIKAGRLVKVEVLPGSFRLRRHDLEAFVGERSEAERRKREVNAVGQQGGVR
jgi:excisionase family DNA binding protein